MNEKKEIKKVLLHLKADRKESKNPMKFLDSAIDHIYIILYIHKNKPIEQIENNLFYYFLGAGYRADLASDMKEHILFELKFKKECNSLTKGRLKLKRRK